MPIEGVIVAKSICTIVALAPAVVTVLPFDKFAVVFNESNCLALSNAVTVPVCDVNASPIENVPVMSLMTACLNAVKVGAEE